MTKTLYQIMIRIKDSFVPILEKKLGVSHPESLEETDVYFKSKGLNQTEKVTEFGEKFVHERISKNEHIFQIQQEAITKDQHDQLLTKHDISVTLHRHRSRYILNDVEISVDRIDEIGTFLEMEGEDRSAVESIATTLGFSSPQFIEHPYDWLKR